ncbi:TauD/TfdA family dioxygenase [Halopseudomonas aestusnigri]|uniref:TauD/TfdA dioxygenase family protein n=1 Tax=Halopseudomonas aestusnigri TaxID=857252 RepID=UPI0025572C43|nr:TauD/TfdA family dioxygenase [Halopseudomonas aestusnigri]MDL2198081.1 TauD/TfdA family dioxygenase [Halopseudomonas aestusnigri]
MKLTVKPLDNIGVEIQGFDITRPLQEAERKQLIALWHRYGVLVFRNQDITPENQIAFSRHFGPLALHPLKATRSEAYPELFEIESGGDKDKSMTAIYKGETIVGRLDWHIDLHYTGKPNHGAVLTAVEVAGEGGLTGFGDLAKAYDALDDKTRELIARLEVSYAFSMQRRHMRYVDLDGYEPGPHSPKKPADVKFPDFPESVYPMVMTHPVTGMKVLGIVEQFLDRVITPYKAGLSNDESIELLERLVAHTRDPQFHYFHQWQPGDMVLWDNWRAMHCATGTPPGVRRRINRTTIEGDVQLGRVLLEE